tara:strand:+ start:1130 stop:1429 length:300 start_codon:yes stop_codon:yes gene_type:complete
MSEVKRGRGRPPMSDEERKLREKEYKKKSALKSRNITANKEAIEMLWDCVVVMSVKIGVKLTISQVITLLIQDWLTENDPTGEIRKDERYIDNRKRRTT